MRIYWNKSGDDKWSFYLWSHFQDDVSHDDDIIRDVGDRHFSEVQRHPGGRVSTKVIHVKVIVAIVDETRRHISE